MVPPHLRAQAVSAAGKVVWDFLKILFIHERPRQREKQAPRGGLDVGLDPGTPGSWPEPRQAPHREPLVPAHGCFFFLKIFIYLFMRDPGRGRSRLHAGSPTWDSIPGPQGHALGCRWC